jgi:hypothetical protein
MLSAEQLQRFARECVLLRKTVREESYLTEVDYRILRSNIHMLLAELEQKRAQQQAALESNQLIDSLSKKKDVQAV